MGNFQMTAYEFIFDSSLIVTLLLIIIACGQLFFLKSSFIARSICFSIGMWLSPIFYLLYILLKYQYHVDIILALQVELVFLFFYLLIYSRLLRVICDNHSNDIIILRKWLRNLLIIYVITYIPMLFKEGYGIFSGGSRIQYLEDSRLNIYLTYLSAMLGLLGVVISAALTQKAKKWDPLVILFLFIMLTSSLLSGSKGGFVLNLVALMSLIKLPAFRNYVRLFIFPVMAIVTGALSTVFIVGNFLSLKAGDMMSLMFSRFFLNNDARALAIDYSSILGNAGTGLIRESLRSLSSLLGYPPNNLPLGQLLYIEAFSTAGFSGANTSSTALLIAYGSDTEKILFALGLCLTTLIIFLTVRKTSKYSIPKLALGLLLINLLSQDFLAFQLAINIIIAIAVLVFLAFTFSRALKICTTKNKNICLYLPDTTR